MVFFANDGQIYGLNKRWKTLVKNTKEFYLVARFLWCYYRNGDLNGFATKHCLHKAVYHKKTTVLLKSAIL